jgi:hypothetical protein
LLLVAQGPSMVHVGGTTAVYWPGDETPAAALAELADHAVRWPGLPPAAPRSLRIIVTDSRERFDSVAGGRAPSWSGALAFPASNTILLTLEGDPRRSLRHELAHLALHAAVSRVPRWFDEGYAAMAAGEWDRLDALRVNWALARGAVPSLSALNQQLAGPGAADAEAGYALATSAVLLLQRLGGEQGLSRLVEALGRTRDFDAALRQSLLITESGFEEMWRRDLRSRYGWLTPGRADAGLCVVLAPAPRQGAPGGAR